MGEQRNRGRECVENGEVQEIGMHEKIVPKRNRFGIWGRPLGVTAPCHTFLDSCFHGQHFHRR